MVCENSEIANSLCRNGCNKIIFEWEPSSAGITPGRRSERVCVRERDRVKLLKCDAVEKVNCLLWHRIDGTSHFANNFPENSPGKRIQNRKVPFDGVCILRSVDEQRISIRFRGGMSLLCTHKMCGSAAWYLTNGNVGFTQIDRKKREKKTWICWQFRLKRYAYCSQNMNSAVKFTDVGYPEAHSYSQTQCERKWQRANAEWKSHANTRSATECIFSKFILVSLVFVSMDFSTLPFRPTALTLAHPIALRYISIHVRCVVMVVLFVQRDINLPVMASCCARKCILLILRLLPSIRWLCASVLRKCVHACVCVCGPNKWKTMVHFGVISSEYSKYSLFWKHIRRQYVKCMSLFTRWLAHWLKILIELLNPSDIFRFMVVLWGVMLFRTRKFS